MSQPGEPAYEEGEQVVLPAELPGELSGSHRLFSFRFRNRLK